MDWKLAMEEDRRMLKRIVAMLLVFASLAERTCDRSQAVRGFVLWILRLAEDVARDFVLDTADDCGVPAQLPVSLIVPALEGGNSPADAMQLAECFRALALLLDWLADLNPGLRLTPATRAAGRLLLALTSLEQILLRSAPAHFAERYDSS